MTSDLRSRALGDELGVTMRGIITLGEEFHLVDRDVRFVPPLFIRGLDDGLRAVKDAQAVRPYLSSGFPPPARTARTICVYHGYCF